MSVVQSQEQANCSKVVKTWLNELDDQWIIIQASDEGDRILSPQELYGISSNCQQSEIDDCSDLSYAQQGYLFHQGLLLWTGDLAKAYRQEEGNQVYFVNAYQRRQYTQNHGPSKLM